MALRSYRTFQALVMAALGLFLLNLVWNGNVLLYINRRFVILVALASLGLLLLSQMALRERPAVGEEEADAHAHADHDHAHEQDHDHAERPNGWNLWWLALPVILGLLIPPRALNTSALANRGVNTRAPLTASRAAEASTLQLPSRQRTVLDWIRVFNYSSNPAEFADQEVDVTGFVYHDASLPAGQFLVGRFTMTCCVADASAIGVAVRWPQANALSENGWVRVRGTIQIQAGQKAPVIAATAVESIPEPENPYLYP